MGIYADSHAGDQELANAVDSLVIKAGRFDNPVAVLAERRQHIIDLAECEGCGASRKECENARGKDPTAPPWFGCCARGHFLDRPCHHISSTKLLDDLLKEVMAGEVRTVAEAYPPPVQGPRRVDMGWLLDQNIWWYPHRRPAVRIADMEKPHRLNVVRYLERKAFKLKLSIGMRYLHDAPDDVWALFEHETPAEWLHSHPLLKAMRKGLPTDGRKLDALAERARHWHTCPMRLRTEIRPQGATCVCVEDAQGKVVGARKDPASPAGTS